MILLLRKGLIIAHKKTHNPVAILDGRDEKTLSKWLKQNKHIKTVTRDRPSAYAKVIEQELPGVMQIADRFYIHFTTNNYVDIVGRNKNAVQGSK